MPKKRVKPDEEKAEMDMSPMIDCVFLLLIFFIVVSSQAEVQVDPKVEPTIANASVPQENNIGRIVVNAYYKEGSTEVVYTDEETKPIEGDRTLRSYIKDQKKLIHDTRPGEEVTLHLRCHRKLAWKDIQKVKKEASKEGVMKVNFASYQQNPDK